MSDDLRLGLVIGGVLAIVDGRRTRAARGLEATDPQDRARAAIALVDQGLQRSTRPILACVATEQDDRVRLAIALAVARRQWEPVDTKQVTQLREWASLELERQGQPVHTFGPAVTRLSDMGGPRPPEQAQPAPTPEAEAAPEQQADAVDWHAPNGPTT
jgi:hypothetical protein